METKVEILDDNQSECRSKERDYMRKDSKRSWLVCLGGIIIVGMSLGITNCFGVLFACLTQEFQGSRTKIAWVGSFQFIWYMSLCPVCGILTQYYTFRPIVFLGTVLFCLGILLSSFVQDVPVFYLTYGVVVGTGLCLLYMSSIIVLPFCFQKSLGTACGLVAASHSGFTMCYGPLYEYLIRKHGWRNTMRIITSSFIPLAISCCLFPSRKEVSSQRKTGELKISASLKRIARNKQFLLWILLMTLVYLAIFVPQVHLMSFCQDIGIPTYISVYNVTLMCGMTTLGKAASGKLIDVLNWNVHTYNILSLLALSVSITLLPLAKTASHVFSFAIFYGLAVGVQCLSVLIITPQLSHPDDAKHVLTYLFGVLSIPGGVGPVLAAWIYDVTRSYHLSFFLAGGMFTCASCLGILVHFLASKNDITVCNYDVSVTTKHDDG